MHMSDDAPFGGAFGQMKAEGRYRKPLIDPKPTGLFIGCDLGKSMDHSAIVCDFVEYNADLQGLFHSVIDIQRLPLKMSYPDQIERIRQVFHNARAMTETNTLQLIVDGTGCGGPVIDLLRQTGKIPLISVLITSGHQASWQTDERGRALPEVHVPKLDLVSLVQVLIHSERLGVAEGLKHSKTFEHELLNFQTKASLAGNEIYGSWRENSHDDIILAFSLAAWMAEYRAGRIPHAKTITRAIMDSTGRIRNLS